MKNKLLILTNIILLILLTFLAISLTNRTYSQLQLELVRDNGKLVLTEQILLQESSYEIDLDCEKFYCDFIQDLVTPEDITSTLIVTEYNRYGDSPRAIAFSGIDLLLDDEYCPIITTPIYDMRLFQEKQVNCMELLGE